MRRVPVLSYSAAVVLDRSRRYFGNCVSPLICSAGILTSSLHDPVQNLVSTSGGWPIIFSNAAIMSAWRTIDTDRRVFTSLPILHMNYIKSPQATRKKKKKKEPANETVSRDSEKAPSDLLYTHKWYEIRLYEIDRNRRLHTQYGWCSLQRNTFRIRGLLVSDHGGSGKLVVGREVCVCLISPWYITAVHYSP